MFVSSSTSKSFAFLRAFIAIPLISFWALIMLNLLGLVNGQRNSEARTLAGSAQSFDLPIVLLDDVKREG